MRHIIAIRFQIRRRKAHIAFKTIHQRLVAIKVHILLLLHLFVQLPFTIIAQIRFEIDPLFRI